MYLIDSNIFLELILGRKHALDCQKLFEKIEEKKLVAVCSHFSVFSICIYLTKNHKVGAAKKFLEYVFSLDGLKVVNTTVQDDLKIIELMEKTGLDFDDCLQYYVALETNCLGIISFDKDFKKTKLNAFFPAQVLEGI